MRKTLFALPLIICCASLLVSGCSNQGTGTVISGNVTYKGQPVTGGEMKLIYADKQIFPIPIRADGSFTTNNVPPGNAKVTIDTSMFKGASAAAPKGVDPAKTDLSNQPKYVAIPAKYADPNKTPLTWEIKGSSEKKEFALTD